MEMREIEAFLAVADELHFGRAAERLGLSTSRVSNLVRTMERRAGTPLFERTSRRVRLTPPGEHLAGELRAARERMERALAEVRRQAGRGQRGGVLRVGFATTLPRHVAAGLARAFEAEHPGGRIVQSGLPTTDLFRWLGRDWPVEVFVTWMPVDPPAAAGLAAGPVLLRVPRAVALATDHPLAGRPVVDIEELAAHEVILPHLPAWYGERWTPAVTPAGRAMRLRPLSATYIEDVLRLVVDDGLAHLTFASLLEAYQEPGVVVAPVRGIPPMPVRPVWPLPARDGRAAAFASIAGNHAISAGWLDAPHDREITG